MEERSQYNSPGYAEFKTKMKKLIGIDLNSYKEQEVKSVILCLMAGA